MTSEFKKLAQEMFTAYPSVDSFSVTSDNQFFITEQNNSAQAHQDYLNRPTEANTKLVLVTREEAFKEEEVPEVVPTEKSTKDQIAAYLTSKGVVFDAAALKADLVVKLNEYAASLVPPPPPQE